MKNYIYFLLILVGMLSMMDSSYGQRSLTAFPLVKNDTNYLAFYSTSAQASNSKFEFAADMQGQEVQNFDPSEYQFESASTTGYSVDGYYFSGSQIFGIPVCYQDTSLTMFILANSLISSFEILYYADVDGSRYTVADPSLVSLGFCGAGSGSGGIASIQANNGLSVEGDTMVQLGGDLIKNTLIRLEDHSLTFRELGQSSFSLNGNQVQLSQGNFDDGNTVMTMSFSNPSRYLLRNFFPGSNNYFEFGMSNREENNAIGSSWHYFEDGLGRTTTIDLFRNRLFGRSDTIRWVSPTAQYEGLTTLPGDNVYQLGGFHMNSRPSSNDFFTFLALRDATDPATGLIGITDNNQLTRFGLDSLGKQVNFANVDSLISYGRVIETGSRLYLDNGAEYVVVNSNPTPVGQLFIEVDSFAMIPLSDGKLAVMDNEIMNLSWFGIVAGETEDFDLMRTNQKRLINAVAWHSFKRSQLFIDGYYRIYSGIPKTTRLIQSCNIKGESPRASVLDFFPKTNDYLTEATDLFTINQPGKDNHRFEGFAMFGDSLGFKQQTYTAILQSGGDPNTIEIRDTNQVWPGLWSNLIIGDTIFYERDITNTASKTGHWSTIASFDSVNRLIVLNDAVIGTEATTNTRIGIRWPRDTIINPDTILAYSKNWTFRDDNFDGYKFLLINHQEDPKPWGHQVIMENLHMDGFTTPIGFSRSLPVLRINNVAVGGRLIAMTFFNNEVPETPEYVLDAFNLTILPSATRPDGGVGYGNNDGVYGSGIYSHTSVPARFVNSTFYSAKGSPSLRFFSSKPTNPQSFTVIENCTFKSGAWLFTSDRMTTKVTNSWFVDSRVSSYNDIEFIDCRFDSTNVVMSANWDKDEGRIRYITLKGIKSDNSRFEISHSNYVDRIVTNVQILDSEFYIRNVTPISLIDNGAIGNSDGYTLIRDCTYKFEDGLQSFIPPNTSGANSGSGFVTASGRVVIDNLQRIGGSETYNATFINQGTQYYKATVINSDLSAWQSLKGDTGFNPRNALELIDSPVNGHQLGASELVYTLDARKPTTGRIRNHDLRNADAGNLGSKVIPQTAVVENDGNDVVLDVNGFDTLSNIHTRWFNLLNPNGNFNNGDVSGWTNVRYRITPSDTLRLKRQTASNPNSNIIAAQDIDLYPNQSYEFQSIPFTPVGSYDSIRVITDAIITTNGTDSIYNSGNGGNWEDGNGTRFIHFPSGFTLQSTAGWTCPIQADGTVNCDEVQGYVSNYRRRWNLILSSLPPASEIISVTGRAMFDPYQFGAFKLIGEEGVKVINPLGGENSVQASLDSLKSAIDEVFFTETITITEGVSSTTVFLPSELQGTFLYQCQCSVNNTTIASPSNDQMTVYVNNRTTSQFEIFVLGAPGAGEATSIECTLFKK